ncbi:CrcB family protein [Bifidobacterium imperatoris]|uniref:Fluoride-specific ion channel FluC n=1 Tax=Bifidobacterium imperatoris TaxID=2020965 RepID=A0A2N5IPL7_9BIFI|nr:CrcB family protein [Bifidobacterium imperatoris]PLS23893.1 family protein CrcB [Bifidobacterium imperatoris]QSY58419.1 CrcB family protein [Bifidobacterium imperatoris]
MSDSANNASVDVAGDFAGNEPQPSTIEISAAQVRAQSTPEPQGAAAAARPPKIPLAPIKKVQARFNPLADGMVYLVVFLGGTLGTAMRYGLSFLIPATAQPAGFWHSFHLPTFIANMLACFIFAGLTSYLSQAIWIRKRVRQLTSRGLGMGMCGGFSTLSALAIEELTSLQVSHTMGAIFYLLFSFAGGLLMAACGAQLGLMLTAHKTGRFAAEALQRQQSQGGAVRHVTVGETVLVGGSDTADGRDAGNGTSAHGNSTIDDASTSESGPISSSGQTAHAAALPNTAASSTIAASSAPIASMAEPSFEPAPITDEIPLTGDLTTGEAH